MTSGAHLHAATERTAGPEAIVLETKLARPPLRPEHIPRRELLAAIRAGGSRRLMLVAAPPGFGKSTLLAEWAARDAPTAAWLSLDESDNDPARFLTYVAAAIERAAPGAGGRALAAVRDAGADPTTVVLPRLLNDLAGVDHEVVLIIEDYHVITDAEVHRVLGSLIEHAPSGFRVVLSTRHDPPLPLARLRARGALAEVRAADLRFRDAEAEAFLVGALGLPISSDDVARLQARTEGWPAALYLAALSLRDRPDAARLIEGFSGDDRYVVDFLTTEVLARLPPDLRTFLLRTSILKRLCGPLCDAVTGGDGSAAVLTELERSNLLLVPLDARRAWYRYHHLFGDLLHHELLATEGDLMPSLHRRASAWYRGAGLITDAAGHAIAGGDLRALAELVGRHYGQFVQLGQLATVIGWLGALPEHAVEEDWLLGFAGGVVFAHAGRIDDAERWLGLAERAPRVARDGQEPDASLAGLGAALRLLRGDIGGTVANGRRALAAAPSPDPAWALGPRMVLASGLWWSGAAAEARTIVEAAMRGAQAAGLDAGVVYALGVRAAIALDEQDERTAEALARDAVSIVEREGLDDHPWAAMARIVHGTLACRRGDLATAAHEIERGHALGERLGAWQVTVQASLALAEVRQKEHRPADARRLLARVRDLLTSLPDPGDGLDRLERTEKLLRLRATQARRPVEAPYWELSAREIEVLRLLPSRLSQREMAAELYVSFNTVRTHTRVIFSKLGVSSRAEAVARGRELGLI